MTAHIIDGKKIANGILESVQTQVAVMKTSPYLAIVNASKDPASAVYIRSKIRACDKVGIGHEVVTFESGCTQEEVAAQIRAFNDNKKVSAIIVQLPLWPHLDREAIVNTVDPTKDADGLTAVNLGKLFGGVVGIIPATPRAVLKALETVPGVCAPVLGTVPGVGVTEPKSVGGPGKTAVIVGRSALVGQPLVHLLLRKDFTVTICHSKTANLAEFTKTADVLISATGKKGLIAQAMVNPGAVVIDVGISQVDGKVFGDVSSGVREVASYITPVPGGIGPITVACLLENVVECVMAGE